MGTLVMERNGNSPAPAEPAAGRPRQTRPSAARRRDAALRFVRWHIGRHGYAPTLRDICAACGISSTSAASYTVRALHKRGLLRVTPGISRGITLVDG